MRRDCLRLLIGAPVVKKKRLAVTLKEALLHFFSACMRLARPNQINLTSEPESKVTRLGLTESTLARLGS